MKTRALLIPVCLVWALAPACAPDDEPTPAPAIHAGLASANLPPDTTPLPVLPDPLPGLPPMPPNPPDPPTPPDDPTIDGGIVETDGGDAGDAAPCGYAGQPCCNGTGCYAPSTCNYITSTCDCVPTTCEANGWNCGSPPDGCGGTLSCGTCNMIGDSCGPKPPYVCQPWGNSFDTTTPYP